MTLQEKQATLTVIALQIESLQNKFNSLKREIVEEMNKPISQIPEADKK